MDIIHNLKSGLKETFSFPRSIQEIKTLKRTTKIMMYIMLLAETIAFIFGKDYGFNGWIGYITGIAASMNLILGDQGRITNFSWGILGCGVWLIVALNNHLIGDICSQSFYFIMQFFGISIWHRQLSEQQNDDTEVEPKKIGWKKGLLITIGTIILYFIVLATSKSLHGTQVYLDATLLPLGIVGQILMTYGYKEQYIAWNIINTINCIIWYNQLGQNGSAITMFVLQIVMFINGLYGTYCWYKKTKKKA